MFSRIFAAFETSSSLPFKIISLKGTDLFIFELIDLSPPVSNIRRFLYFLSPRINKHEIYSKKKISQIVVRYVPKKHITKLLISFRVIRKRFSKKEKHDALFHNFFSRKDRRRKRKKKRSRGNNRQLPIIFESLPRKNASSSRGATRACSTSSDLSSRNIAFVGHVRFTQLSHNDSLVSPVQPSWATYRARLRT